MSSSMAFVLIVIAAFQASAELQDSEALSLIQQHADILKSVHKQVGGKQNATTSTKEVQQHILRHAQISKAKSFRNLVNETSVLPDIAIVNAKPENVLKQMGSQMQTLGARLLEVQRQNAMTVAKQKSDYEVKLKMQRADIHMIELANEEINSKIMGVQASNEHLREHADQLMKRSKQLNIDLELMHGNMTTAQEFTEKALEVSDGMLHDAAELQVLADLDQKDAKDSAEMAKKHRLTEISQVSLAQVGVQREKPELLGMNTQDLLQSLMASFGALSQEQNVSELMLKESFEKAFAKGADRKTVLLTEQATLNITLASAFTLHEKLLLAVKHLGKVQDQLLQRGSALRVFAQRIGARPMPVDEGIQQEKQPKAKQPIALLQLSKHHKKHNSSKKRKPAGSLTTPDAFTRSSRHAGVAVRALHEQSLPELVTVISKPERVLKEMGKQMAALEAHLVEAQEKNAVAMEKQKASYEDKLKIQRAGIREIELANNEITREIVHTRRYNEQLRKQADKLLQRSRTLKADLEAMKGNMTTAQEFTDNALESSTTLLSNATELKVLTELTEHDAVQSHDLAKQQRLNEIGKVTMSLLQTGVESKAALSPQDLLQSLFSSLGDLSKQQNESETSLKESFEKEFQKGAQRRDALLEEQAKLNTTRQDASTLHDRLAVAVQHLNATQDHLYKRGSSLRLFAQRMGALPMPSDKGSSDKHSMSLLRAS